MKYFLTLNLISCLFLTACGGSSSSTSSTAPVIAPKETTPTESLPHTVTKGIEMLAQAKLAATSESKLTTSLFKKGTTFSFGDEAGKLAYQDFLDSPEEPKKYIANLIICNSTCYKDDTALKTMQIQFSIVPQSNGVMKVENLRYSLLDENTFDLYAIQQPLRSLINSNRTLEKSVTSSTSFEVLDENHRIFEFSIYGDPFKDELSISKLKIAFSPHGQWFSSISQDVLMVGTRVTNQTNISSIPVLEKNHLFSGVAFNSDYTMQEKINFFDFNLNQYSYMKTRKFSSMFDREKIKHGLYTPIGKTNAFGYGYTVSTGEYSIGDNPVHFKAGVFVIDPSGTFALGIEQRQNSKDVSFILQ